MLIAPGWFQVQKLLLKDQIALPPPTDEVPLNLVSDQFAQFCEHGERVWDSHVQL